MLYFLEKNWNIAAALGALPPNPRWPPAAGGAAPPAAGGQRGFGGKAPNAAAMFYDLYYIIGLLE